MNKKELLRKSIHFSGILYIPFYETFGVETVSISLLILSFFFAFFESLRLKKGFLRSAFRNYEQRRIGAYFYFLLAITIITPLFPKEAVFVAISVVIVGDGLAGISRGFGRDRVASVLMFLSSTLVVHYLGLLDLFSLSAILFATIVERIKSVGNLRLEDNFTVPIVAVIVCSVKYISHA